MITLRDVVRGGDMAVIAEIDYLTYAATCKDGKRLLELPEQIQQGIVKHCDEEDMRYSTRMHPDYVANNLLVWTKKDVIKFVYFNKEVADEFVEQFSDDEVEIAVYSNFTCVGKHDGCYYIIAQNF